MILNLPSDIINNMTFYTLVLAHLPNICNMPKREESFFVNEVTKKRLDLGGRIAVRSLLPSWLMPYPR